MSPPPPPPAQGSGGGLSDIFKGGGGTMGKAILGAILGAIVGLLLTEMGLGGAELTMGLMAVGAGFTTGIIPKAFHGIMSLFGGSSGDGTTPPQQSVGQQQTVGQEPTDYNVSPNVPPVGRTARTR